MAKKWLLAASVRGWQRWWVRGEGRVDEETHQAAGSSRILTQEAAEDAITDWQVGGQSVQYIALGQRCK